MSSSRPLRVCQIMSADLWAGAEAQVATAASYLAECPDVTLTAVLFNHGGLERELIRLGVETAVVDERRHSRARIVAFLTRFLRDHAVDLVHTHRAADSVPGSLAARLAGVPHVVRTVHGLTEPMRGWARARFALSEAVDKATLWMCADRIVAVSRATSAVLARTGYKPRALTTIHNGIDLQRVRAACPTGTVRRGLGVDDRALFVGTAGRLVPVKGHEYLIRAAAYIAEVRPDVRVLLAGSGPRDGELRALARTLGVEERCVFVDPARDDRFHIYDLLAALDVFALPSLSEGIPMALLEAMALGKPAVASAVGGIPEIVTNGVDGLLVEPRSPRAIADACLELVRRPAWAAGIGDAARATIAGRFSRERQGQALVRLYQEVVRTRRSADSTAAAGAVAIALAPFQALAGRVRRKSEYLIERRRAERLREDPAPLVAALAGAERVLVVCHGNIIRSPFAARLLDRLVHDRSRAIAIASAGLSAEPGRPSHSLAIETAAPSSIDLRDHAARRLTREDVARADAVFVMDVEQRLAVRRLHPPSASKIFLLTSLAADTPLEVRDPIDGDASVFQTCYDHITRAVQPLVRVLAGDAR
jgi:glycosyltransferase involved in cell wall biosynthesis/protein-tyrosine-phosphatase